MRATSNGLGRKALLALTFTATFSFCSIAFAIGRTTQETLAQVQKRYASLQSLTARFEQTSKRHNVMGALEDYKQSGMLYVQKPGFMRWEYEKPESAVYLSDGKTLSVYREKQKTLQRSQWSEESLALKFLLGKGDLSRDFKSQPTTAEEKETLGLKDSGDWITLTAHSSETTEDNMGSVAKMFLRIDPKLNLIEEVIVMDPIGAQTRWSFSQPKIDASISAKKFQLNVPKQTRVIE